MKNVQIVENIQFGLSFVLEWELIKLMRITSLILNIFLNARIQWELWAENRGKLFIFVVIKTIN